MSFAPEVRQEYSGNHVIDIRTKRSAFSFVSPSAFARTGRTSAIGASG
jgi:hypothetical protein